MIIEEITRVTPELVDAFARLLPQLSSAPTAGEGELGAIVAAPESTLLVARLDDVIVGSLTLTAYRIPTGLQCRIDDVVVDVSMRGRGIGEGLSRRAITLAHAKGARSITLTSRPEREAANRLYQRLGFVRVETNVYRYPLR